MIVSLIQIDYINRYHINCRPLSIFGIRDPLQCHGGKLIQSHHLLEPILKPQQKPLFTRDLLHHPSQLLAKMPGKLFTSLLLQLNHLCLHNRPRLDLLASTPEPTLWGLGETNINNKQQVSSWLVQ